MILVTGCAGFIGSHLVERLVNDGQKVIGIDNFSDYYSKSVKKANMKNFMQNKNFRFIEGDLLKIDLGDVLKGVEYVFHQAAQAGVRKSWGKDFQVYADSNILATQRLLEACKDANLKKFIFASSSSVYGDVDKLPMKETSQTRPLSPYGVSKLAGEHLCYLYWKNFRVPTISLRYFTVYGPRQRPDMAFHKFISFVLKNEKISVYGDGNQTRDFTYVSDVVEANILAMKSDISGEVVNIGGGSKISVNDALSIIEGIAGKSATVEHTPAEKGDVKHTAAVLGKAEKLLGYKPVVGIEQGLRKEYEWLCSAV